MGADLNDEANQPDDLSKGFIPPLCRLLTVLEEALDSLINGTV